MITKPTGLVSLRHPVRLSTSSHLEPDLSTVPLRSRHEIIITKTIKCKELYVYMYVLLGIHDSEGERGGRGDWLKDGMWRKIMDEIQQSEKRG